MRLLELKQNIEQRIEGLIYMKNMYMAQAPEVEKYEFAIEELRSILILFTVIQQEV